MPSHWCLVVLLVACDAATGRLVMDDVVSEIEKAKVALGGGRKLNTEQLLEDNSLAQTKHVVVRLNTTAQHLAAGAEVDSDMIQTTTMEVSRARHQLEQQHLNHQITLLKQHIVDTNATKNTCTFLAMGKQGGGWVSECLHSAPIIAGEIGRLGMGAGLTSNTLAVTQLAAAAADRLAAECTSALLVQNVTDQWFKFAIGSIARCDQDLDSELAGLQQQLGEKQHALRRAADATAQVANDLNEARFLSELAGQRAVWGGAAALAHASESVAMEHQSLIQSLDLLQSTLTQQL